MTRRWGRRPVLPSGERVLASARVVGREGAPETLVVGTREALLLGERRLAWERVQTAGWDEESGVLTVTEVAERPAVRRVHTLALEDADRLLQLVRERVTASIVAVRAFPGGRVVARRSGARDVGVVWQLQLDDEVDPDDPEVRAAAREALEAARLETGLD